MGVHAVWRAAWCKSMYLNLNECAVHFSFWACPVNFKQLLLALSFLSVLLFICPNGKISYHCVDFHEILYLRIFWKSLKQSQVGLKSDKNDECFMWGYMHIFYITEFFFELGMFSDRSCGEIQKTDFMFNTCFPKIISLGKCGRPDRPQMTI